MFKCAICSILDQQQKQTIPFSGGQCMGEFDGRVFVATSRDVYYLLSVPIEKQVCRCLIFYLSSTVSVFLNLKLAHSVCGMEHCIIFFIVLMIFTMD